MLKGEIEIVIRDSETLEVIDRIIQPNITTDSMMWYITADAGGYAYIRSTIVATSMVMSPTRKQSMVPTNTNGNMSVVGSGIPGNGSPDWFPPTAGNPAFAQWSTRLGLPTVTRTIATVLLTDVPGQGWLDTPWNYSGGYQYSPLAYSRLATPCTQTPTQFFDIYYRIYFPLTNQHDMPQWMYNFLIQKMAGYSGGMVGNQNNNWRIHNSVGVNALPLPVAKSGDEEIVWPCPSLGVSSYMGDPGLSQSAYYRRKYSQSFALTDVPGLMIGSLYFRSGNDRQIVGTTALDIGTKIQNLLGHRSTSQSPFLDISNLQQSLGSITLGGDWNNRSTPSAPGLYAPALLPEMYFLKISDTGAVGSTGYTWYRRPFFGAYATTWANQQGWVGTWRQNIIAVPFLGQLQATTDAEFKNNLLGDMSKITVRQLSSWDAFDDSTVIVVKMDEILLYNLASGGYWRYSSTYTDIRQIALINGIIYVGCRNTGLYSIDPYNSSTVTGPITPGGGIDLSIVYGVAKGYNDKLWVAGNNCLASFNGTTWTKYDSTTAIPFNIAGISDSNWNNIEYITVDIENANDQMLIVRRTDASVNASSIGVWWSTIGAAYNHGITPATYGWMTRVNRKMIAGRAGIWALACILSSPYFGYYRMSFGTTSFTSFGASDTSYLTMSLASVMFVKNASGQTRWLSLAVGMNSESPNGFSNSWYRPTAKLVDASGTVTESAYSAMAAYTNEVVPVNFENGVAFLMRRGTVFFASYKSGIFTSNIGIYPFTDSSDGGPLAYLGQDTYGWNGSSWSTSVSTPRLTHLTTENLAHGITVKFNEAASGSSFVDQDWFNFVTCEGLQKDSATTGSLEYSFYYKRAYKDQTLLTNSTIPATAVSLATGVVGLDLNRSSSPTDITVVSDQFVFGGGKNAQQFAIGNKQVTGNFEIQYTPFSSANGNNIAFGIGHASTGCLLYGFVISNGSIYVCDTPSDDRGIFNYPTLRGSFGTFGSTTDMSIKRVGAVFQFIVNSVIRWTCAVPLSQLRFDLICQPYNDWTPSNWTLNRTCPKTVIATNGSDNAVRLGTLISGTGSYNPLYYAVDSDTRNTNTVTIGGVPAIAYHYDGTAAAANEVTIDVYMGTMHFNVADESKTIAAQYTYMTHE